MNGNDPTIRIRGLEKCFGPLEVLRGVDLDVHSGESLVIIGPSGCGKSVLLKHMIGLIRPDAGSIRVKGEEITEMGSESLYELRKRFGMLFQGAALFDSLTVGENVGLGLTEHTRLSKAEIDERVMERLKMVGMGHTVDKKPSELSGGMRKRVGLARAIAMDPEIILYDEPTTGLDPIMADVINELIRNLQSRLNATSITVTHDMISAYKVADRIAMLHEGKIIFEGAVDETKNSGDPVVQQFIRGEAEGPVGTV
ncbi:MAG: ABC transporter ATP-binding protein [Candidatus Eisenbacteria bacterium]|nr:ABC transporter ATP-binding protein [Candidatus Eisenbacteria bacterium]